MGTSEKNLYKEYQKRLKEKSIRQLTNKEMEKNVRKGRKKRTMNKAEEAAFKAYPFIDGEMSKTQNANAGRLYARNIFKKGYEQAEKDLELTWEDIPKIFQISEELKTSWWFRDNEQTKLIGTQPFWEEVLKRFKNLKK